MATDGQRRPSPRVTIAQIAQQAGVSVPTVSKVLNGRAGVSAHRRAEIQRLLHDHGYERRRTGRRQRVGLIDLVIRDLDPLWAMPLLQGAEEEAGRVSASIVLTSTHGRQAGTRHWVQHLATRRTDALVLVVSELAPEAADELSRLDTPMVLVDPAGVAASALPTVVAANRTGGRLATEHLLRLGHRRIGIITGPDGVGCSEDRLAGYADALRAHGVPLDPRLQHYGDFTHGSGASATRRMLELTNRPTAIFAGTDQTASGVYEAAAERALTIPEDLSVVGFDDGALAPWMRPALTTVRLPLADMARTAIRTAAAIAYDGAQAPRLMELPTSLTVRASTAAAPRAASASEDAVRAEQEPARWP